MFIACSHIRLPKIVHCCQCQPRPFSKDTLTDCIQVWSDGWVEQQQSGAPDVPIAKAFDCRAQGKMRPRAVTRKNYAGLVGGTQQFHIVHCPPGCIHAVMQWCREWVFGGATIMDTGHDEPRECRKVGA